ncbi:Ser-Thr-rich glycosyl-phosphatidyl-inositol-anchored membrane family protein [compost metagenome]
MNAQWSKATPGETITRKSDNSVYYKLDINAIRGQLLAADKVENSAGKVTVNLPTADGKIERFAVNSFPVMDESLANQYQLGSYVGVGIDDPSKYVRFSVAPNDFQSMMISDGKYEFIEPATSNKTFYSIKGKSSKEGIFSCNTKENLESINGLQKLMDEGVASKAGNKKFHTLRLALSTTGEYTAYFGGVAGALTQINATMTRVNGVFEQEFNLHLNMVNAPALIFTTASSDPYSDASQKCKWSNELMLALNGGTYGVTNTGFDIGHLFGRSGGGGNAGCIGCIGSNSTTTVNYSAANGGCGYAYTAPTNYKGSAYTSPGIGAPMGDAFDIDYVAHEFGHQLGANHTFSRNEGYSMNMEPGSGSTIMGYAGVTGSTTTDVQNNSDPYFHTVSITQVQTNLASKTVDVETDITNNPPVVTAMATTYTIPAATAFALTAIATDSEGDALTYCWEQVDSSTRSSYSTRALMGTLNNGASFRSWIPTASPTRYFPKLATVLGGAVRSNNDFEAASTVARTTNFRVTVRDNKGADSQTAYATQTIVVGSAAAFTVNTVPTLIAGGNSTITWVVSGTTASPYNVANVKIDFTSDAGANWTTLAASVPNSGTASVAIPESLVGKTGHIRVSAIGNVFYAVKPATVSATLAVSDLNNSKDVKVYPNPVKDILNVTNITLNSNYEIFNTAGQLVSKGNLGTGKIAVSKLTKGVYFINIDDNGTSVKTKFVKD